jgi:hypothetical protein
MENTMKRTLVGMIAALAAAAPAGAAFAAEKPVSIVLVHGAFVDASGWRPVYELQTKKGYEVLIVQNPTITLEGDATAARQAIALGRIDIQGFPDSRSADS